MNKQYGSLKKKFTSIQLIRIWYQLITSIFPYTTLQKKKKKNVKIKNFVSISILPTVNSSMKINRTSHVSGEFRIFHIEKGHIKLVGFFYVLANCWRWWQMEKKISFFQSVRICSFRQVSFFFIFRIFLISWHSVTMLPKSLYRIIGWTLSPKF